MSTRTTEVPIIRAVVATVRANNAAILALIVALAVKTDGVLHTWNSDRIHEGVAPDGTLYPFLTYQEVYAPFDDDWSKRIIRLGLDIMAVSDNQVEASNLDQLVMQTLEDSLAAVTGQNTMYCRATAGVRLPEIDLTGKRMYRVGHTYEMWTDQPL